MPILDRLSADARTVRYVGDREDSPHNYIGAERERGG